MKIISREGFNSKVSEESGVYKIYTCEKLLIKPFEKQRISLPYKINCQKDEYCMFKPNKELSLSGLDILWDNLNDDSRYEYIEFFVENSNFDKEMLFNYKNNPIQNLIGSNRKVEIRPGTEFGSLYFIKYSQ